MPFADRSTHRLSYETLGREGAPPVLLVMGMSFSARAWGPMPERLAGERRVLVFDNRGVGASTAPRGRFRMADLADDAAAVLHASGVGAAHVFGVSMGGMVALELALRHPARVRSLVLGATLAAWKGSRKATPLLLAELLLGGILSRHGCHALVGRALASRETLRRDPKAFRAWIATVGRPGARVLARQVAAVAHHDARPRLGEIRVPALVLTGDEDRLVPPENARALAEGIPGARLVVFPRAGHVFPFEAYEETVREVEGFLRSVPEA